MTQQHPMTPPPELVRQWVTEANEYVEQEEYAFANRAAQWGADQELEACCEWLSDPANTGINIHDATAFLYDLRATRRGSQPPSLKRVALLQLDVIAKDLDMHGLGCDLSQIRLALEQLPD